MTPLLLSRVRTPKKKVLPPRMTKVKTRSMKKSIMPLQKNLRL
jgi:hypothetical protein